MDVRIGGGPSVVREFLAVGLIDLPGDAFTMGTDGSYGYPADGEGLAHEVELSPFNLGFRIARSLA